MSDTKEWTTIFNTKPGTKFQHYEGGIYIYEGMAGMLGSALINGANYWGTPTFSENLDIAVPVIKLLNELFYFAHNDLGWLVIYSSDKDGRLWARPFDMFVEKITVPRFQRIGSQ